MAETRTMILSTAAEAATADHADLRRDVLNGCPWHDVKSMLRDVGLRPTRQRMALGWILFAKGDRHLTAEMLYEEATKAKVPVSLATVYNTLHQFTDVGLLRQVAVDGSKTYFDTNTTAHHHFFVEGDNALVDIPGRRGDRRARCRPRPPATRSPASTWWSACARRASNPGRIVSRTAGLTPGLFVFARHARPCAGHPRLLDEGRRGCRTSRHDERGG